MTRTLLALFAAGMLSACALPEPTSANAVPYQDKEVITGSRIPAKSHNAQGTKRTEVNAMDREEMLRPKATPMMGQ